MRTHKGEILREVGEEMAQIIKVRMQESMIEWKGELANVIDSLDIRATLQQGFQQQRTDLQGVASNMVDKPSKSGESGYLARCKAPSGWDQHSYEATLLRGAWLYINALGNPEGGVDEDETALNAVNRTFPGLDEDHIITTLDHVHMQAYGTLFRKK